MDFLQSNLRAGQRTNSLIRLAAEPPPLFCTPPQTHTPTHLIKFADNVVKITITSEIYIKHHGQLKLHLFLYSFHYRWQKCYMTSIPYFAEYLTAQSEYILKSLSSLSKVYFAVEHYIQYDSKQGLNFQSSIECIDFKSEDIFKVTETRVKYKFKIEVIFQSSIECMNFMSEDFARVVSTIIHVSH